MTRMIVRYTALVATAAAIALSVSCTDDSSSSLKSGTIDKVNHVVVIYLENRAFDNTYGEFAGAAGLADAATALPQVDSAGQRLRFAAAGCGAAVSDESRQRSVRHRALRAAHRRDARSRAPLLSGAGADRRRQDGQVRERERREGAQHGALPHVGAADGHRGGELRALRSLLPQRVRRIVSQSPISDCRSAADISGRSNIGDRCARYRRATSSPTATSRPTASR